MRSKIGFVALKVRISAKHLGWLLTRWQYMMISLVVALLFFELMYWLFNLRVLGIIVTSSNLSVHEKLAVLSSPFHAIAATSGTTLLVLMLLVSLVQGIAIAALVYIFRHQKKLDPSLVGGSSLVGLLAVLGLGCPACGTSLLTPIVAIFVSGSAVAVSERIMQILLPIALVVGLYGLYTVGLRVANTRVAENGAMPQ